MNMKMTLVSSAIGIAMGSVSIGANAALTTGASLQFDLGSVAVIACNYGSPPPCQMPKWATTDVVGSYFGMDVNPGGKPGVIDPSEKTPIESLFGIQFGVTQSASGGHNGGINGTENPNIDNPWEFGGNTGMHQTTSPITVTTDLGNTKELDMSGWNVVWNGIASIPLAAIEGAPKITCDTSSCSVSSNYTLDGAFHVTGAGFTTVRYEVHLEGKVVPVPAAVWLFGSGLLGLAGVARRKKANKTG